MGRSKSSQLWLQEHHADPYVLKSRREGYRSRAVYKLIELQEKDRLLKPKQFVIDLGAAPGGWTEYASQFCSKGGRLIAVDLLEMDSINDVDIIQGDFTEQKVLDEILDLINNSPVDLVLSDMAPNISGIETVDQPKSMYLVELAFEFALQVLDRNGSFAVKMFQGEGFDEMVRSFRKFFKVVKFRKPKASRPRSREVYAVCQGLK
ncbi:MAG: 23S rRNA (uridine(2552)-2'-O)-methyltransferase RlmE [Gammaproteobacteria bacterium]|jgi:23S rRNA (uridine2552-2'-O)-methyltransferase|nr:23S rRNA (uridine(2552)-2'-O)-methyltransferase RlmE [Gammaproteobacteria bacterium]MBT3725574.1 23S rRNA (uridine(2552)-2'-O)-methyltransferase RlmE [Gammaproteobacteria bacterium]MBT4078682.1 23S rRNA (uridine(2552)-2'-O)-methyltransferase RlmE [Gammaproteobacteria bacterium]MBT4197005.1 23S rRNA (uridine(2552)-2'-O)-methyltransferase RlmE [Gammaproteobacteria bacterium]MBT4451860.1 23S rRNA (uridine(2552)-2'-O)-methyltransferase RlmE [Gammaproteobacteria bacterium]